MKKVFFVLLVLCAVSCSEDDNVEDGMLNGEWTLTNVVCFCGFPDPPAFNLTQLTFSSSENEVTVSNNGPYVYFREDGTYLYTGSGNRITFDNGDSYNFEINGNSMQLIFVDEPNIADDEVTYSFVKNQ